LGKDKFTCPRWEVSGSLRAALGAPHQAESSGIYANFTIAGLVSSWNGSFLLSANA